MRLLVLGGTGYIGPHLVRAAVDAGHDVAVFNRGLAAPGALPGVEQLVGDRATGDLAAISGRDWDAVVDLPAYSPRWVRALGQTLADRVGHYTFVSTEAVYRFPGAWDESSAVLEYDGAEDPYALDAPPEGQYGAFKVLAEREAERWFPGRTLIPRPGFVVGPGEDPNKALPYWVARLAEGGDVLVAGDPSAPVQFIDVRDLAEWIVRAVEQRQVGPVNLTGPGERLTWGGLLDAIRVSADTSATLTWVPVDWLRERGELTDELSFFPANRWYPGIMNMSADAAVARGLTYRPTETTTADTLYWYLTQPPELRDRWVLGGDLAASVARDARLIAEWVSSR